MTISSMVKQLQLQIVKCIFFHGQGDTISDRQSRLQFFHRQADTIKIIKCTFFHGEGDTITDRQN